MPTPIAVRQAAPSSLRHRLSSEHDDDRSADWRCSHCAKLLGVRCEDRMHLRFARAHEYFVGFPVVAVCRGCGTLNQALSQTAR